MNLEEKDNSARNFVEELKTLLAKKEKELEKPLPKKEDKKDDSAFGGKPFIPRVEAKRWFLRHKNEIWGKYRMGEKDIKNLDEEFFPAKKYGPFIEKNKREPEKALKDLEKKKWISGSKRWAVEKKINILKKFSGK